MILRLIVVTNRNNLSLLNQFQIFFIKLNR
jgi:hypothetical protein